MNNALIWLLLAKQFIMLKLFLLLQLYCNILELYYWHQNSNFMNKHTNHNHFNNLKTKETEHSSSILTGYNWKTYYEISKWPMSMRESDPCALLLMGLTPSSSPELYFFPPSSHQHQEQGMLSSTYTALWIVSFLTIMIL